MGDDGAGAWGAGCGEDGFFGEVDFVDFGGEELFGVVVAVGPDGIPSGGGVGIGVHLAGWVKARLGSVYRFSSRRVFRVWGQAPDKAPATVRLPVFWLRIRVIYLYRCSHVGCGLWLGARLWRALWTGVQR